MFQISIRSAGEIESIRMTTIKKKKSDKKDTVKAKALYLLS